jgi:hypothetical protein
MRYVLIALLMLGCKSKEDRAADEFRAFADRMCSCDSSECQRKVKDDYREWEKGEMGKLFAQARGEWIDAVEAKIKHGCR